MFENSAGLSWVGMAGLVLLPRPLFHHQFIRKSWGSTRKNFIRISSLVPKLFTVLCFKCLLVEQKKAICGTQCTKDGLELFMIAKKNIFVIIFNYYFQYVTERIFTFDRVGKKSWSLPFQPLLDFPG